MTLHPLTWAVALALLLPPTARAGESWVGLKVMPTKPKVQLRERVGDREIAFDLTGVLLPVLKEHDGRLRVRDYRSRGNLWLAKRDYAKALLDFDDALRLDPNHGMALARKAYLLAAC